MKLHRVLVYTIASIALATPAVAGPPYVSDDPEPTDDGHYEVYAFTEGTSARPGTDGSFGIDFNYGAATDLQLTAVLPIAYESPHAKPGVLGLGNIELGAKYRVLHQEDIGWDVAAFPQLLLPSLSPRFGETHSTVLVPIWFEKDWDNWSTFGGGGCAINRGSGSKDFYLASWALAREVLPDLQIGMEVFHQTPDTIGERATTGIGAGMRYDLSENYHFLAYVSRGLQNAAETNRTSWYSSILFTF